MTQSKQNKLIVIGGPTASGKTSLAIQLAQHYHTEILSADSRQCYKELTIGVAKPSEEELGLVPHHFINSHSIQEEVTAGTYMRYGLEVLDKLFTMNKVVVAVGGTGLYIKALCEGLDEIPSVSNEVKGVIEKEFEKNGIEWLQGELQACDPAYLAKIDANNPMRLLRGLIFYKSHHQSILNFIGAQKKQRSFDIDYYAIDMPRDILYNRINGRVDDMMSNGLLNEVEGLQEYEKMKALQTVGYKELFAHLNGDVSLEFAVEKIKQHTRNYAKRQLTWFKNQGSFNVLRAEQVALELQSTNCR